MPGADWIFGVSQLKSTFQLVTGDFKGARRTQENFLRECPGVSQVTSVAQLLVGDPEGALETQKCCLNTVYNVVNATPVLGHVKGVVHHMVGDSEGGNRALNAATRTAVVIGAGAAAGVASGGLAAVPAAIGVGIEYDLAASHITGKPQGFVAAVEKIKENPTDTGAIFDAGFILYGDNKKGCKGSRNYNS